MSVVRLSDDDDRDTQMNLALVMTTGLGALVAVPAMAQDRLPTIPPTQYTAEQKHAAAEFEAERKVAVFGPFEPMMHSPQVMTLARAMGDYLRYKSAVGNTLSELAILMTAREWTQDYEWSVHYPIALKAGIRPDVADAIADGRRPPVMSSDEKIVYDYADELLKKQQVSDATFERAKSRFGTKGVVDLTGIVGYYTFLAMQLNAAQYPAPHDGRQLPKLSR
jgi:4-carboxymuconolactone decarboxylase